MERPLTLANTAFTCVLRCIPQFVWIIAILLCLLGVCILFVSTYYYSEASAWRKQYYGLSDQEISIRASVRNIVSEEINNSLDSQSQGGDYLQESLSRLQQQSELVQDRLLVDVEFQQLQSDILNAETHLAKYEYFYESGFIVGACAFFPFALIFAIQFVAAAFTVVVYIYYGIATGLLKHVQNVQRISTTHVDE